MSPKNAILLTTDEQTKINLENDFLQYLHHHLINFKFPEEIFNIEDNCEHLTKTVQENLEDSTIFILTDKNNFIFKTLSKLFDEKLVVSKHLASVYKINSLNEQNVKNIAVPRLSKIFLAQTSVNEIIPVCIQFKNIFVLPNNLNLIKIIFQNILVPLLNAENDFEILKKRYLLNCNNNGTASMVSEKLSEFVDSVSINNYCIVKSENDCELNVNLASKNFSSLVKCEKVFNSIFSTNIMDHLIDRSFWDRLTLLRNMSYVDKAVQVLKCCFTEYAPHSVFICFNGGKDCTVLLYLTCYVLQTIYPLYSEPILCLYIRPKKPFPQVENFIEECKVFYNLKLYIIEDSIKEGLNEILTKYPNLTACLMGTRRTDPYSENLGHFMMTDPDWPQVMRVSPLLHWKYSDIWTFILTCKVPYCELYDCGYTSLDGKNNSRPNPALRYFEDGVEKYHPAYKLLDEEKERDSRMKIPVLQQTQEK